MTIAYSNPRMAATIPDWPSGSKRVTAVFSIETHPARGQRALRVTTGAPKVLTYARQMRIVDGDDGRTYVLALSHHGQISVMRGDMKYQEECVFPDNMRYPALRELFTT
jgi:hypothetical protein